MKASLYFSLVTAVGTLACSVMGFFVPAIIMGYCGSIFTGYFLGMEKSEERWAKAIKVAAKTHKMGFLKGGKS